MISSSPTPAELQQYATWLSEAENALHRLNVGAQEVSVQHDGEQVTYTAASRTALKSYIGDLRRALGKPPLANAGIKFKPVVFSRARGGGSGLI